MKCVVDTCIFNKLVKGDIQPVELPAGAEYIATHIQFDELNQDPDIAHKRQLLSLFKRMMPIVLPTESTAWEVSKWDAAKWNDGERRQEIKNALDAHQKKKSNMDDARIAELAIANGYCLLTSDFNLAKVAEGFGCYVKYYESN